MLKTRRQCRRTMVSQADWSPFRQRWMISSIACGSADEAARAMPGVEANAGNGRMIPCATVVSQPFQPSDNGLVCDGVSVRAIAEQVGTPVYIYSARAIRDGYRAIDEAFADYPHAIHYALK